VTYGDAVPTLTYVVGGGGLVGADALTGSLASTVSSNSNVGAYAIDRGNLSASSDYAVSFIGNNVTVEQRAITIAAHSKTMSYGDAVPTLTYVIGGKGLLAGDVLTGALFTDASSTSNIGTYAIGRGTLTASTNYSVSFAGSDISIWQTCHHDRRQQQNDDIWLCFTGIDLQLCSRATGQQ